MMMMMKAAKLGWAVPVGHEQGWSKARVGLKHEQGKSRGEQSKAEQGRKRVGAGLELGRS